MASLAVDALRVSAGPLGLLVVLLMFVATVFLIRNMNSRLRKLPPSFPPSAGRDEQEQDRRRPPADH
jgi:hypothetical protein